MFNKLRQAIRMGAQRLGKNPRRSYILGLLVALSVALTWGLVIEPNTRLKEQKFDTLSTPATEEKQTSDFTDAAKVYKISLPTSWMEQKNIAGEVKAKEFVALAPKVRIEEYKSAHGNDFLAHTTIALYATTDAPKAWFTAQGFITPVESAELTINSNPAFGAKIVTADISEDHYVISHNGALLHFTFHRNTKTYNPEHTDDYSTDLGAFDKLFTSLSFLN
jgi:hypothetical protein